MLISRHTVLAATVAVVVCASAVNAELLHAEKEALVDLYRATDGPSWRNHANWLVGDPCLNRWHGVTCDMAGVSVTSLVLTDNSLTGDLPAGVLGPLKQLRVLWLANNRLGGTLAFLRGLPSLVEVNVSNNIISGPLSDAVMGPKLQRFWARNNKLQGEMPHQSKVASQLQSLKLEDNELCGKIPPWLLSRSWLRHALDLSGNPFVCPLPEHPVVRQSGAQCRPGPQPDQCTGFAVAAVQ